MKSERTRPFLPYGRQSIDPSDIAAVEEVLRGDYLTTGPAVSRFETALAAQVGARHAVSCSSGTAALHLACLALGLLPGDAVIVPAITFLATANMPDRMGAKVVFADVDPDNGLITPETLSDAYARARASGLSVKAVFPVHVAGQSPDLVALEQISTREGAVMIEDACHAIGSFHACADGRAAPVGACRLSTMTVFSFHPVKTIAAGEGGAVTTNDSELNTRLEQYRNHGMTRDVDQFQDIDLAFDELGQPNPWYYEMADPGWNYRLSDLHAALATSQIARLQRFVDDRRALASYYDDMLAAAGRLAQPIRRSRGSHAAWHLYPVLIDFAAFGTNRRRVMKALESQGIGSQVHYIPVHRQPYYRRLDPGLTLTGAEQYYARTLSLPLFVGMTNSDVKRVVTGLTGALTQDFQQIQGVQQMSGIQQMTVS